MIYAISHRVSDVESHYHSSKLELLAIARAVERLRPFLLPLRFTIVTDCQALVFLNAAQTKDPQVARWASSLCEYSYEIKHRKGEKIQHVDALSRAPSNESNPSQSKIAEMLVIETSEQEI